MAAVLRTSSIKRSLLIGEAVILAALLCGCIYAGEREFPCAGGQIRPYSAPTYVGDLYNRCYSGCVNCDTVTVNLRLYLDTMNLPSQNGGGTHLVTSSLPLDGYMAGADRLEFEFAGVLPDSIDPGIVRQPGWKIRIDGAKAQYCKTCMTNCGLAPVIFLRGDIETAEFIYDPQDTLGIYLKYRWLDCRHQE